VLPVKINAYEAREAFSIAPKALSIRAKSE